MSDRRWACSCGREGLVSDGNLHCPCGTLLLVDTEGKSLADEPWLPALERRNLRVSLKPYDDVFAAVLIGALNSGTVIVDTVAPSRHFQTLDWLISGRRVNVRQIRKMGEERMPDPLYFQAVIELVEWPAVILAWG